MNHSSYHDQPYSYGHVPFQLELGNGLLHSANCKNLNGQNSNIHDSKSVEITRNVDTGITYLSLPAPKFQLVKHQQLFDAKHQCEQDFFIRFRLMTDDELDEIFSNLNEHDANRYINSYQYLYQCVLKSILRDVDLNEEISQIKHEITYQNAILPILMQNHKLAKRERKILYNIVTKSWRKFDERIQNEINVQHQFEQLKSEHQDLTNMKIKQEHYQTFYSQLHDTNINVMHLKREIQQLIGYKGQLENEIHEIKTHCSHSLTQLNFLKCKVARTLTNELNNLQLQRDSLIKQTELMKYNLTEQTQEYDNTLNNHHTSLNSFRFVLIELEQQLKKQTENELLHLKPSNQVIHDDAHKLILILENKVDENKLLNIELQKTVDDYQENILKQKQSLIYRDACLQLKTQCRTIGRQLRLKLKEHSKDDILYQALIQHHDSLLTQKNVEQIRTNTSNEHTYPLIDENVQLKNHFEHLHRENTQINANTLLESRQKVARLKQIHQTFVKQNLIYEHTKNNHHKINEQLHMKTNRITGRMNNILNRIQQNRLDFNSNYEHIRILENKLSEEQQQYLQATYLLTEMKNHSDSYGTKQQLIKMQIQVASNNIKHSQYRLKSFTEQLSICHNGVIEQQTSLNKLYEFHSALEQKDEINLRKLSNVHNQYVSLQNQYEVSQKHLKKANEDSIKYLKVRSILGRMVVRRINLCQLLYKKLARFDEHIHQRENNIQIISKCIHSLKIHIRQNREQNRKLIEKKDKFQLEVVKAHIDKILDRSHEKQRVLRKQIFQRHFCKRHSLDPLPREELAYLKNKLCIIKNRFIKIICRGIICNLVLVSIQQEFSNQLEYRTLKSNRENCINLSCLRSNLYQLMRQLKAKTAENNMLVDYRYYFQVIHTDAIQQLIQWKILDIKSSLMASSVVAINPNESPQKLCRYFLSNTCRYGDKCYYSHDQTNSQINNICRYYLRGKCIYGDRCRYVHAQQKPEAFPWSIEPPITTTTSSFQQNLLSNQSQSCINLNTEEPRRYEQNSPDDSTSLEEVELHSPSFTLQSICPYAEKDGYCEALETGRYCPYIHGDLCDLCEMPLLHPTNEKQREQHRFECLRKHEADCEEAFAIQRSQDKKCGVCLETVWDRDGDKRFGILENCDHIFCLECIRTWRSSSNYEHKIVKACPECRIKSDFVTPTKYWPENDQAKRALIQVYKENLQKIHCKFFKRGDGLCPFGSKCFYRHVDKHGQHVQLDPPRRRQRLNIHGDLENYSDVLMLSIFSPFTVGRVFDELDILFDDDDIESYGSYLTDDDDFRFAYEHD
ncbi:unnamed protein product [Rotaria socialis]